jgi:hypothetical protein
MQSRPPALTPRGASSLDVFVLYGPAIGVLLLAAAAQALLKALMGRAAVSATYVIRIAGGLVATLACMSWFVLRVQDYRQLGKLASPVEPDERFLEDAPRQFYYADGRMVLQASICLAGAFGIFLFGSPIWLDGRVPSDPIPALGLWVAFIIVCASAGIRFVSLRLASQPALEIGRDGLRFLQGYKRPLELAWREIDFIAFNCNRARLHPGVSFPTADIHLNAAALERRRPNATASRPYLAVNISWLEGGMGAFLDAVEHFRPAHVHIVDSRRW